MASSRHRDVANVGERHRVACFLKEGTGREN
jgi:hypothetical protein